MHLKTVRSFNGGEVVLECHLVVAPLLLLWHNSIQIAVDRQGMIRCHLFCESQDDIYFGVRGNDAAIATSPPAPNDEEETNTRYSYSWRLNDGSDTLYHSRIDRSSSEQRTASGLARRFGPLMTPNEACRVFRSGVSLPTHGACPYGSHCLLSSFYETRPPTWIYGGGGHQEWCPPPCSVL